MCGLIFADVFNRYSYDFVNIPQKITNNIKKTLLKNNSIIVKNHIQIPAEAFEFIANIQRNAAEDFVL